MLSEIGETMETVRRNTSAGSSPSNKSESLSEKKRIQVIEATKTGVTLKILIQVGCSDYQTKAFDSMFKGTEVHEDGKSIKINGCHVPVDSELDIEVLYSGYDSNTVQPLDFVAVENDEKLSQFLMKKSSRKVLASVVAEKKHTSHGRSCSTDTSLINETSGAVAKDNLNGGGDKHKNDMMIELRKSNCINRKHIPARKENTKKRSRGCRLNVRRSGKGRGNGDVLSEPKVIVLNWLMDFGIVAENEKVACNAESHKSKSLKGFATRGGIQCSCCSESLPKGNWHCPLCQCAFCRRSDIEKDESCGDMGLLKCHQSQCKYHIHCDSEEGMEHNVWNFFYCEKSCKEVAFSLTQIVGSSNDFNETMSWTLLRYTGEADCSDSEKNYNIVRCNVKLALADSVLQECFILVDPRTATDMVAQAVYNRGSNFSLLNCEGFHCVILGNGDDIISVAMLRVHGTRVAEMPLIGIRSMYRKHGMCRLLLNTIEKMLASLHVETDSPSNPLYDADVDKTIFVQTIGTITQR